MNISEKIDQLIEKYLGMFNSTEVYTNPTMLDIKQMKAWSEIRFIINIDTNKCFVWNSEMSIHSSMFNKLLAKGEFTGKSAQRFSDVYNREDIIAGYAYLEGNKMRVRYAYGNDIDPDTVKSDVKKLFKNPDELFLNAAMPDEYR